MSPSRAAKGRQAAKVINGQRGGNGGLGLLACSFWFGAIQFAQLGSPRFSVLGSSLPILGVMASFIILNGLVILFPGTLGVSEAAFAGVIKGIARGLKTHGFTLICFMGVAPLNVENGRQALLTLSR